MESTLGQKMSAKTTEAFEFYSQLFYIHSRHCLLIVPIRSFVNACKILFGEISEKMYVNSFVTTGATPCYLLQKAHLLHQSRTPLHPSVAVLIAFARQKIARIVVASTYRLNGVHRYPLHRRCLRSV